MDILLDVRGKLRVAKQWALADVIRNQLSLAGIVVEDRPEGPRWYRKQ
jgi:cysteinyl-tRNA synthetase